MIAPHGFAPHRSGLLVPELQARLREVWTRDEWRAFDKATRLLTSRGVAFQLRCDKADCPDALLAHTRQAGGDVHLTCGCTIRVLTRAI